MSNADGGMIAVGISDKTRCIEGVDRMCRELSAIGTKEPQYHLVAFIMKASIWANILKEGHDKGTKRVQKGHERILALIEDNPKMSIPVLAKECGTSVKSMRLLLDKLKAKNIITRIGPNKAGIGSYSQMKLWIKIGSSQPFFMNVIS